VVTIGILGLVIIIAVIVVTYEMRIKALRENIEIQDVAYYFRELGLLVKIRDRDIKILEMNERMRAYRVFEFHG